jgi:hypothetical protein
MTEHLGDKAVSPGLLSYEVVDPPVRPLDTIGVLGRFHGVASTRSGHRAR